MTTSFSAQGSVGATGTIPEGSPKVLGLSGGLSYAETPTVTWSLPDTREYSGRLLAPMGADQLTSLAYSGWDLSRVLRTGTKKMNRLRNKEFRIEDGIYTPPTYGEFLEALGLMSDLSREGLIDFAYGVKSSMGAGKIPLDRLDTRAIPDGLQYGLQFMTRDDPNVFEPLKLFKPLFLRFSKRSDDDPRAKRLRELLSLNPRKYSFGIVDTVSSGVEQLLSESGKLSQVFDTEKPMDEIVMNNRSMMEVLYFASAFVQVPEAEMSRSVARQGGLVDNREWLTVIVSPHKPSDAWLKVEYREHWFYIAANDLKSRTSFALLDALFAKFGKITSEHVGERLAIILDGELYSDPRINEPILHLYTVLFHRGQAHSVEAWRDGRLVGGLYGVSLGGAFFGESMFSRETDASKVALVHLVAQLKLGEYVLLDCQFMTAHLRQFGVVEITRADYRKRLAKALKVDASFQRDLAGAADSVVLQPTTHTS